MKSFLGACTRAFFQFFEKIPLCSEDLSFSLNNSVCYHCVSVFSRGSKNFEIEEKSCALNIFCKQTNCFSFWGLPRVTMIDFLAKGRTTKGEYYMTLLKKMQKIVQSYFGSGGSSCFPWAERSLKEMTEVVEVWNAEQDKMNSRERNCMLVNKILWISNVAGFFSRLTNFQYLHIPRICI